MIYISSKRALAEESFDTVFYLSSYLESTFSKTFAATNEYLGLARSGISPLDDYQSFYYFGSFIMLIYSKLQKYNNGSFFPIVINIQIWLSAILYFILNFLITFSISNYLNIKNKVIKFSVSIFVLFFIANFYYNNVFTFYGNTYRNLISGFILFIMYMSYQNKDKLFQYFILIGIMSSALISTSASGFFIGFILIYTYVAFLFYKNLINKGNLLGLLAIIFPTLQFVIGVFFNGKSVLFLLAYLMIGLSYLGYYALVKKQSTITIKYLKLIVVYIIPLFIWLLSIRLILQGSFNPLMFFIKHSLGDMVWDFFDFKDPKYLVVNVMYWSSLLWYLIKSKNDFKLYFIFVILIFINPISQAFVSKYLAALIYYRSYETLFNNFSIILVVSFLFDYFSEKNRFSKYVFLVLVISLSIIQSQFFYHFYFIPENEDYSALYKLEESKVEVFNVLNTKIILEGYERANVVSQIESIKGYVPNIRTYFSYSYYYPLDGNDKALQNIFINRDYFGQDYFGVAPDYANTCNLLIDRKVDFIVVAKNQSYWLDGHYEPLFIRVRECAKDVYENDKYIIYQMFWK